MPLPASKHVLGESIKLRVTKFRIRHGHTRGRGRLTPYAVTHWALALLPAPKAAAAAAAAAAAGYDAASRKP
ncbi:hypothetical protein CSOJ01_03705 [Colletotrichum sojae]|uniref:Uncharacterized protein n=1 Tax=Colletotrichum sojae TaxID=2175907 RepID=A0A8H6JLK3_9PEZI|nr:hypothetical protein CSOJ01_03705 [Colletotrichum sojae]